MCYLGLLVLLLFVGGSYGEQCQHPAPSTSFNNSLYQGRWYEVGKYQTAGGAIFQAGTVCTIATFDPYVPGVGDGDIGYSSRKTSPTGSFVNATGVLSHDTTPGHFQQQLFFYGVPGPHVDYNVIWLDEDSAIEYDCSEHVFGFLDYCIHFMSRTPSIVPEKLEMMKEFAIGLGLNSHDLDYMPGSQEGCWDAVANQ